ncbi:MAG: hypothetical protein Q9221_002158 [Calogaya cf. arnoldii]
MRMHLLKPFLLISLTFNLCSALPPVNPASPFLLPVATSPSTRPDILCYNAHYATTRPDPQDCQQIISTRIAPVPASAKRVRRFSRRPTALMLSLPHTWKTSRERCGVTIDIPGGELEVAEASLMDIKMAASDILEECVYRDVDHFGGIMQVGKGKWLQVRVDAPDQRGRSVSR